MIKQKPNLNDPEVRKWFTKNGRGGRKDYGGYSPCISGSPELWVGSTLNNCTGGAWGLFAMAENNPDCKIGFIKSSQYPQDAGSWYNNGQKSKWDNYERGQEPRLGAVICYGGGNGHVAYVIDIDGDKLTLLSSGYGNSTPDGFDIRTVYRSKGYRWPTTSSLTFQGFIYSSEKDEKDEGGSITSQQAIHRLALDVIEGKYGNGFIRKQRLYDAVQNEVNRIMRSK